MIPRFTVEGDVNVRVALDKRLSNAKNAGAIYAIEYIAHYAVFVHENLNTRYRNGQAKFLEQPARESGKGLGNIVATVAERTGDVALGLEKAANTLLALSQQLVPVKTGFLKRSGKVRREK